MNAEIAEPCTARLRLSTQLVAELSDPGSRLRAVAQRSKSAVIVHAGGEVDAFNEGSWRRLLDETAQATQSPGTFVVDVNGMDFMSCCAFEVLADEAQRCRDRRVVLRLVSAQARVGRVVEACGFGDILSVHPTAGAALAC